MSLLRQYQLLSVFLGLNCVFTVGVSVLYSLLSSHTLFSISFKPGRGSPSRADFAIGIHLQLPGCSSSLISIGMAAATSKSEMPPFSYAQAAKGISTASTTSQPSKPTSVDQSKGVRYDHQASANVSTLPAETEVGGDSESSEISWSPSLPVVELHNLWPSQPLLSKRPSSPTFGIASTRRR